MSWFSRKATPLSPMVQTVVDLLADPARWEIGGPTGGYDDFTLKGPEGLVVTRGSYEGFWYTVAIAGDELTRLNQRDHHAIEPAAQRTLWTLKQPQAQQAAAERAASQRRIEEALSRAVGQHSQTV